MTEPQLNKIAKDVFKSFQPKLQPIMKEMVESTASKILQNSETDDHETLLEVALIRYKYLFYTTICNINEETAWK